LAHAQVPQMHQGVLESENHRVLKDELLLIGVKQLQIIFNLRGYEIDFYIYHSAFDKKRHSIGNNNRGCENIRVIFIYYVLVK
jgi:hypothetical protein